MFSCEMKVPKQPESAPETKMEPQFFRYQQRLTSISLEESALTLVENDSAFGVLLSESTRMGRRLSETILDSAILVRCRKKVWSQDLFEEVSIRLDHNNIWIAEDLRSNRLFREPSIVPYRLIYVSEDDYVRLMEHVKENRLYDVFAFCQRLFGALPGFDFAGDGLAVPENYAAAGRLVADAEYVTEK